MPLPSPNLDDRNFDQLLAAAKERMIQRCPGWNDRSAGDPGIVLLELFTYLTETMIYRLNRIPEKAYIEFLRLIGVRLEPPAAASVTLLFTLNRASDRPIEIPRGTRATVERAESGSVPLVFVTSRPAVIPPGATRIEALAHNCELVEGELAGKGTGLPGLSVTASRPPIIAPTDDELDLVVGVEAASGELEPLAPAVQFRGKSYRVWREVENFSNLPSDQELVYIADRMTGTITFAPALRRKGEAGHLEEIPRGLAAAPAKDREIRLWYRRGGGLSGNVAANTLTALKDPIPGVKVTNPKPAMGGRSPETSENALIRGPLELHSLQRAVTARDFELVALKSGAVGRAKAFTRATLWAHAPGGTVEVLLVPSYAEEERPGGRVSAAQLRERETEDARLQIERILGERRPLGTACQVNWARYKTVRIKLRVVARQEEDPVAVKQRLLEGFNQSVSPLPFHDKPGWRFGQPLRVSHVYEIALTEAGVSYLEQPVFEVEEVPERDVTCLAADFFQSQTWYAGSGNSLFRSMDDGDGWETIGRFPGEQVGTISVHPKRAGLLAVSTVIATDKPASRLYVSWDCGENWKVVAETAFKVQDTSWMLRDSVPILLMATDVGLYELPMHPDAVPVQILVHEGDQEVGFYAVATSTDFRGVVSVAVAAQELGGTFLSQQGGKPGTFRNIGLKAEDVRVLAVQSEGVRFFLWAGLAVEMAGDPGKGCYCWELVEKGDPPDLWQSFTKGWNGGSCRAIAFQDSAVLAASHHGGVLRLTARRENATWGTPELECGLPLREAERLFHPVEAVAAAPQGRLVLAGGLRGIFRSRDRGNSYANCSSRTFTDKVTLPPTWLFCSGEHQIDVVSEP